MHLLYFKSLLAVHVHEVVVNKPEDDLQNGKIKSSS